MAKMVKIDLHNNMFTNTLPDCLWKLKRVNYIDFSQNDFSGKVRLFVVTVRSLVGLSYIAPPADPRRQVPEELGYLEHLRVLKLNDNRLTGEVPESFTLLDSLETLHCQFNNFKSGAHWLVEYLPEIEDFDADEDGICSCSCKKMCILA